MKTIQRLDGNRFIACYTGKAQCDYKGVLQGGRGIVIEAKSTDKNEIRTRAVSEKQYKYLEEHREMDAKCFIAVSIRGEEFYMVPWEVWEQKQVWGSGKFTVEELNPYKVPEAVLRSDSGYRRAVMFLEGG